MNQKIMLKIGVTGGIGSGKSTVCNVWQSIGAHIINADDLAKRIMTEDEAVKREIIEVFGAESYHPGGTLNRKHLAEQAFGQGRVGELNAIVHPRIPAKVSRLMDEAEAHGVDVVVYEAALLLQNLRPKKLDFIVLVLADRNKRTQWVKKRDSVAGQSVIDRMNKQQDFSALTHRADWVIENDGTLDQLKKKAKALYKKIVTAKTD